MAKKENGRVSGAADGKTLMLVQLGALVAIMLILHFTGFGYFKIGVFSLTIMAVPMIIGAVTIGKTAGAVLGGIFGVTVLTLPETMFFMNINLAGTFFVVVGTRVILGFLCGLMFQGFSKFDKQKIWSYGATGLITAMLNTVFIMGGIALIFGSDPAVREVFGAADAAGFAFFAIIFGAVIVQAAIEAGICMVIAGSAAKAIHIFFKKGS
ncbi:MAG: ECF transporter S component [Oscillospiraceae bacterium]|jgi:uncharacterized membrane protein|nr:ECF transporter S component [Oscillospiraceae bacterium]